MSKCIDILVTKGYTRPDAVRICREVFSNLGYVNLVLFVESIVRRSPKDVGKV